jgi:hypothetical protein
MSSSLTLLELLEVTMFGHETMELLYGDHTKHVCKIIRFTLQAFSTCSYIHLLSMRTTPAIKCHCTGLCDALLLLY